MKYFDEILSFLMKYFDEILSFLMKYFDEILSFFDEIIIQNRSRSYDRELQRQSCKFFTTPWIV
jgi:hypothetical protein